MLLVGDEEASLLVGTVVRVPSAGVGCARRLAARAARALLRELLEADDTWDRLQCLDQLLRKDAPWVDQLAFHDQDNVWAGSPSAPNPAEGGSGLTLVALAICMWDHPHQGTADFGERLFRAAVGMVMTSEVVVVILTGALTAALLTLATRQFGAVVIRALVSM